MTVDAPGPADEHLSHEAWFKTEPEAIAAAYPAAEALIANMTARGYHGFRPMPLPPPVDALVLCEAYAACRLLVTWIPSWMASKHAGEYALRVDTLATREDL